MNDRTAHVHVLDWFGYQKKGTIHINPDPAYFKVENPIPEWWPVKSMRFMILRNGKPAPDIRIADWGVKLYPNKTTGKLDTIFSVQAFDTVGSPSSEHDYSVQANIEFGAPVLEGSVA